MRSTTATNRDLTGAVPPVSSWIVTGAGRPAPAPARIAGEPVKLDVTERKVVALTAGAHWVTHAAMLALPAAAILFKTQFQLNDFTYGLLANLSFLGFGLGALPAGLLVDRIGPRKTLRLCLAGIALGAVVTALSTELWSVIVGTTLMGLAAGLYHPAGLTLISANLARDARGMGYHGIAGSLGLSSGNFIAAGVLAAWGWPELFWLYAGLCAVGLVYQLGSVRNMELSEPHTTETEDDEPQRPPLGKVALALIAMALLGFSYRGMVVFMPIYFGGQLPVAGLTPEVVGNLATGVVLIGGVAGQFSGGIIAEKRLPLRSATLLAVLAAACALAARWVGGWGTLAVSVLLAAAVFATQPITNALIGRLMPAKHRGKGYGVASAFNFGFGSLAASAGGALAEATSLDNLFLMLAASALAAALVIYLLRRRGGDDYARPRRNTPREPRDR